MKLLILLFFSANLLAAEGIFSFSDTKGYEKCLGTQSLKETVTTKSGTQERFLSRSEIIERCIKGAESLLAEEKNPEKVSEFLTISKRNTHYEFTLGLVHLLVKLKPGACNDASVYEVLLKGLQSPKNQPSPEHSYYDEVKPIVQVCLKDKTFKQDFLEERENSDSYISENACVLLKELKQVSACKKG